MRSILIPASLVCFLALDAPLARAEAAVKPPSVPRHLMTMDKVRSDFGAPERTLDAVGAPPIARWVYGDYTVYFEHDLVLTSVRHRAP